MLKLLAIPRKWKGELSKEELEGELMKDPFEKSKEDRMMSQN